MHFINEKSDDLVDIITQVYNFARLRQDHEIMLFVERIIEHYDHVGSFGYDQIKKLLITAHNYGLRPPGLMEFFVETAEMLEMHKDGKVNLVIRTR